MHPDLEDLDRQYAAVEQDARDLVAPLTPEALYRPPAAGGWSAGECLEHITIAANLYLQQIDLSIEKARRDGLTGGGPYTHGWIERWVLRNLEPPTKFRAPTGKQYIPQNKPRPPAEVLAEFVAAHEAARARLPKADGLDLIKVRFRHPTEWWMRFTLLAALKILAGHARRHLWQARQALRSA